MDSAGPPGLRLLLHGAGGPARNMAVDEALLLAGEALRQPVLRLYRWAGAAISLGRFQTPACLDEAECRRRGVRWVRRPTGGRAVWHGDSVTFSLVAAESVLGRSPLETNRLAQFGLAAVLARLGLRATLTRTGRRAGHGRHPLCLAAPWQGEAVLVDGFRVAGVAQARRGGAVLVQGSLALALRARETMALFAFPSPEAAEAAAQELDRSARGLASLVDRPLGVDKVEEAVAAGFAEALGLLPFPGRLTPAEEALARDLASRRASAFPA